MKHAFKRRFGVPLILFFMFTAPGLLALFFYMHPEWLGHATLNKGQWVQGAVKLPVLRNNSKWSLVYWSPQGCAKDCLQQLDKLARVRLALGRRYYDLDELLLMDKKTRPLTAEMARLMKVQNIHQKTIPVKEASLEKVLSSIPEIFIISPDDYFVLSYAATAPPDDIYKDIKHLLTSSESRSRPSNAL